MNPRFQADNDLDQRIVTAVRRLGPTIDFQTAPTLDLHGMSDPEVLALAADQGRVLVSHDRRTLPDHFRQFIALRTSPGVIIVSQKLSIGRASASDADEYVNIVYDLP